MGQPKKHSQTLINQAHELAFQGELTNAQIAKKLNLSNNQLTYIIYQCKPTKEVQQVAVRLRPDVYERLDKHRKKTRISKTATVEQAIIEHLDREVSVQTFHVDKAEPAAPKASQSLILPKKEKTMLAKAFDWLLGT